MRAPNLDGGAPGRLSMAVVEAPAETDEVIDTGGGSVFVERRRGDVSR